MRQRLKLVLIVLWLVAFPFFLAGWWLQHPDFLRMPASIGMWLFDQYKKMDPAEDGYGFEFALCWLISFLANLAGTLLVLWLWRSKKQVLKNPA